MYLARGVCVSGEGYLVKGVCGVYLVRGCVSGEECVCIW